MSVAYDITRHQLMGDPVPVVEGVGRGSPTGVAQFSVSNEGTLLYYPGPSVIDAVAQQRLDQFVVIDRSGAARHLETPAGLYGHPRISTDGRRLAMMSEQDIAIADVGSPNPARRLTFGGTNRFPLWTPDGQRVVFQTDREGDLSPFWQCADGAGPAERLTTAAAGESHAPDAWSPDGKRLLFTIERSSSGSRGAILGGITRYQENGTDPRGRGAVICMV